MAHSYLEYFRLKAIISYLRYSDDEKPAPPSPDDTFTIPSRDGKRKITVNVYQPKIANKPSPVLINWNGGAFVFDAHGADELFCRRVADEAGYIVLDASYALAPEYPFPGGLEDAEDAVLYVLEHPDEYDVKNIVLSGFSSGGNLALGVASGLEQQHADIPNQAIRGVVAFYPPTSMAVHPAEKKLLNGALPPIPPLLKFFMGTFRSAYLPPGVDPSDPRLSVLEADPKRFPNDMLIITAEKDRLAPEAEALATKLQGAGKNVQLKRYDGVRHGWDKTRDEESDDAKVRDEAYGLVVNYLLDLKKTDT